MKKINVNTLKVPNDNKSLMSLIQNLNLGDIHCIIGHNEKKVMSTFYKLVMTCSLERTVGYFVSKKQYGRQNLYIRTNSISQSIPLHTFEDIENEVKRMTWLWESPVIFIKDYFKISTGSNYWQKSRNTELMEAKEKLKIIANKYKIPIYIYMFFESKTISNEHIPLFKNP